MDHMLSTKEAKVSKSCTEPAYFDIGGIKTRCRASGVGEPILLLHGWGGSIESMELLFARLERHYAVFTIDFPGHGKSGLPPRAWSVSDFSEYVLRVMDALHLQRPHIIAHSFGGRVVIKLAASHPERVGKIILVDSAGIQLPRSSKYYLRFLLAKIGKYLAKHCGRSGEFACRRIYRAIESKDYASAGPLRETFVKVVNEDLSPMLPHIKAPTLLIWGADDKETPVSAAKVMERLIPNTRLIIFKNAGHFSYVDQYSKFCLVVEKFLRE